MIYFHYIIPDFTTVLSCLIHNYLLLYDYFGGKMIQITCYQTCKIDSKGWQVLFSEFPHHARNSQSNLQWLGDGYYFWTDSDRFAKWWGTFRLKQPYCITRYSINIEYDMIFDMVGNTEHIEFFFEKLLKTYQTLYEHARRFSMTKLPEPTIATVIDHMRNFYKDQVFKYQAMKICDAWLDKESKLNFTPQSHEFFPGARRIQLCIFSGEESCIQDKMPHFPKEYCDVIAKAT